MKPAQRGIGIILALAWLGGCARQPPTDQMPTIALTPSDWTVGEPVSRASSLSGDAAKAVLIARAFIEEQSIKEANVAQPPQPAPQPQFLEFRPEASDQGWDVYVELVGNWINDRPARAPGHSTVVRIDRHWKVFDYGLSTGPAPASQPSGAPN